MGRLHVFQTIKFHLYFKFFNASRDSFPSKINNKKCPSFSKINDSCEHEHIDPMDG